MMFLIKYEKRKAALMLLIVFMKQDWMDGLQKSTVKIGNYAMI